MNFLFDKKDGKGIFKQLISTLKSKNSRMKEFAHSVEALLLRHTKVRVSLAVLSTARLSKSDAGDWSLRLYHGRRAISSKLVPIKSPYLRPGVS